MLKIASRIVGFVLLAASAAAGLYVGIWIFLVGGIEEIVRGANAKPMSGHDIAWGLVKAFFPGWEIALIVTFLFGVAISAVFLGWGFTPRRRRAPRASVASLPTASARRYHGNRLG